MMMAMPGDSPETILLVKDEDAVRAVLHACLTRRGYVVLAASGPEEGMTAFQKAGGAVDLVLTDFSMPGMRGELFYRRLAASRPGLKVLFMLTHPEGVIRHERDMGTGVPFIQKPFGLDELARKVRGLLEGPVPLRQPAQAP